MAASAGMDSTAMDADMDAQIEMTYTGDSSESVTLGMSGNMRMILDESDIQMAYTFDISAMGDSMTMSEWLTDGWVYVQMEENGETVRTKTQVNTEETQALLDQIQSAGAGGLCRGLPGQQRRRPGHGGLHHRLHQRRQNRVNYGD